MNKLKICLVSLSVSPDAADGEAKVIRAYFDYLTKQGHDVKLITGKWNIDLHNPKINQIKVTRKRFLWIFKFNHKAIKYLKNEKFDIIHANSVKAALPIILSNQKKFICTIHDFTPFETELTIFPFEKILTKFVSKKATYLTTVSNYIKEKFSTFLPEVDKNRIFTIYNGINIDLHPNPEEAESLKKKLKINGPLIIYLGRIASYKGVEHIITAYKIAKETISNLNLIIGGIPDFSMREKYQQWKKEHKDILFSGYIEEKEIPIYYSMADLFIIYSSSSEGFGLTPLEAIACGTPVICSDIKVFKEVFEDKVVFVPPNNPTALANNILRLIKNESLRLNLINKAKDLLTKYSWSNSGKKLEQLYYNYLLE